MRIFGFLLCFAVMSVGFSGTGFAKKGNGWNLFSKTVKTLDFEPYLGEEQIRQRSLWDGDNWTPEAWIDEAGDEKRIMRDFYTYKIVTGQYEDKQNIPVLEVGYPFTQLSGLDQRRVLKFVDYVFQITSSVEDGMFYVYFDEDKEEPMGLFNKHGFQSY